MAEALEVLGGAAKVGALLALAALPGIVLLITVVAAVRLLIWLIKS